MLGRQYIGICGLCEIFLYIIFNFHLLINIANKNIIVIYGTIKNLVKDQKKAKPPILLKAQVHMDPVNFEFSPNANVKNSKKTTIKKNIYFLSLPFFFFKYFYNLLLCSS